MPPATGITATSYTFTNLAPGNYAVRVTDACGAFQTRQATLTAAPNINASIYAVYERPDACGNMDYYVIPGLGTYYPHTYYAYNPDGSVQATLTVNGSDLVPIPGISGRNGFKFTLPNPPNFQGTYYTFKHTNSCITDVNDPRVIPGTPSLGGWPVSTAVTDCDLGIKVTAGEGWKIGNLTVTVTPAAGGAPVVQHITDVAARSTTFENLAAGSYTVTITDECGHTYNTTYNLYTPNLGGRVTPNCKSNIPGTIGITIDQLTTGWQLANLKATITSGPASYYSAFMGKTYTVTYPIEATIPDVNNQIYFSNLAPGDYTIVLSDGCRTKEIAYKAAPPGAQYTIPAETVTGCAGSRVLSGATAGTCTQGLEVDLWRGANPAYWARTGANTGFSVSNAQANLYTLYYFSRFFGKTVLSIPPEDIYIATGGNNFSAFLVKKSTITVTDAPTNPHLTGVSSVQCEDGTITIGVIPNPAGAAIVGYSMKMAGGNWTVPQASPIFTVPDYGTYEFRLEDECGNAGVSSVSVNPNPVPVIKTSDNQCIGSDITLFVELPAAGATAVWTKPDGSTVPGAQLYIPNASASDKGTYSVTVTYTIGNCTQTKTSSVVLSNCIGLPVNWGVFDATIKNGLLLVNWSTLKEINNSYFEIHVTADGKNWIKLDKVESAAVDGNSDVPLQYSFTYKYSDILSVVSIPLFGLLALAAGGRRKRITTALLMMMIVSAGCFMYGCKRDKDSILNNKEEKIFVRIVQVDKDGEQKASSIVQAIRE